MRKNCQRGFIWQEWSHHRSLSTEPKAIELYQLNNYFNVKVQLKRFHLNGNTIGFDPQTQTLELHTK